MPDEASVRPFQVELRGIVELLSRNIYSGPRVYLRELLQNGQDAITARRAADASGQCGTVRIVPADLGDGVFRLTDDGIGLTADEAASLLSTVGRSSKRDTTFGERREGFLGQFGIGLLSCFMVSDRIVIRSKSFSGAPAIEWVGTSDGQFSIRQLSAAQTAALPVGTELSFVPRPDDASLASASTVELLAREFAEYLPISVQVTTPNGVVEITKPAVFLDEQAGNPASDAYDAVMDLGKHLLGRSPLAAVPLDIPGTQTRGVAFILPFSPPPGARQAHRVYLGRMLLSAAENSLLPDWAFFARCVVSTDGLSPTASREQLIDTESLSYTREAIGEALRTWLFTQSHEAPQLLDAFVRTHSLGLKAMAVHDPELAAMILPWLQVETTAGDMDLVTYLDRHQTIRYVRTVDEFRQIAPVVSRDEPVINGGYSYETDLLHAIARARDARIEQVSVIDVIDALSAPALADRDRTSRLEMRATKALADHECRVIVRSFEPDDLPALYVEDPQLLRRAERVKGAEQATGAWASIMGTLGQIAGDDQDGDDAALSKLCLNWASPLVQRLAELDDIVVLDRSVRLLYVQAMLAGHRPLAGRDRALLTEAVGDLVQLSIGFDE